MIDYAIDTAKENDKKQNNTSLLQIRRLNIVNNRI